MLDILKRTMYAGVGLGMMAKERIEELGKDLAKQAKLSEHEGKELLDDLMKQSETARADFESRVESAVARAIANLNLASRSQLEELAARVEALENRMRPTSSI